MVTEGTVLAERYRLEELLGRGGMAEVRRAHDSRIGRDVAVKLLRPELVKDPAFEGRLRREAQSAASLHGPGIVAVYDTGEEKIDGDLTAYIVMELVPGRTLRDVLAIEGPMSPTYAMTVTKAICAALAEAHRAGIVHRDVKPGNVMLTPSGEVKVMDFGIARLTASAATITETASVSGTAHYLSPEQARGEHVDARSDVYSTGCLLYELVTGSPPFTGDSAVAVAYQHVREDPVPPSTLNPDVPPALDSITLRALAKNPAQRYQTAGEFRDDLDRALGGRTVSAPEASAAAAAPEPPPPPPTTVLIRNVPPAQRIRRRAVYTLLSLSVIAVFVLGLVAARAVIANQHGDEETPNVVGQSLSEARTILDGAGLRIGRVSFRYSTTKSRGQVLSQSPAHPILLGRGDSVDLVVSQGVDYVPVAADIIGETQAQASSELKALGFTVTTSAVNSKQPSGQVLGSTPAPGSQVAKGSAVVLKVSSGQVVVPGVVGLDASAAADKIRRAGFEVIEDPSTSHVSGVPLGQVVAQNPAGGETHPVSDPVTIFINEPPAKPTRSPSSSPAPTTSTTKTPPPAGSPSGH